MHVEVSGERRDLPRLKRHRAFMPSLTLISACPDMISCRVDYRLSERAMMRETIVDIEDEITRADWIDFIAPMGVTGCEWIGCNETDPANLTVNRYKDRPDFFVLCHHHRETCIKGELMEDSTVSEGCA